MPKPMNIVFIASECVPYAKTGGMADVVGALPSALSALDQNVIIIMPLYDQVDRSKYDIKPYLEPVGVWMGDQQEWCSVYRTSHQGDLMAYFVEFENYYGREGLYHDHEFNDYLDNARRFTFFTRAALQVCIDIGYKPDIVHVHDWQTATAAAYLKIWHWDDPILGGAASVLTIHNIGYQGKYPAADYGYTGFQSGNFTSEKFEDFGEMNLLKGGIHYADFITTVSPRYAWETRTPEGGQGLAPYLNDKGDRYVGVLNGVDYSVWHPDVDPLIPSNYSIQALEGKARCKRELQERMKLTKNPAVPLIGIVSRFVHQKGLDLLAGVIEDILRDMLVQFVILGSGDKGLETFFGELPQRYPGVVSTKIGYDNELSHWIEAGADFFLMPSRYEPCGLNQIYSLKYGTLPIVRATGGLDDTVDQYDESTGHGTGFKFWEISPQAVYYTIGWAVSTYYDRPEHIRQMQAEGMMKDFSWEKSARAYLQVYEQALDFKRGS